MRIKLKGASVADTKNLRMGKFAFRLNFAPTADNHNHKVILATGSFEETIEWIDAFKATGLPSSFTGRGMRNSLMGTSPVPTSYDEHKFSLLEKSAQRSDSPSSTLAVTETTTMKRLSVKDRIVNFERGPGSVEALPSPAKLPPPHGVLAGTNPPKWFWVMGGLLLAAVAVMADAAWAASGRLRRVRLG